MDSINMSIHHAFKSTYKFEKVENDNKNTKATTITKANTTKANTTKANTTKANTTKGNTTKGDTTKRDTTKDDFVEHEYLCSALNDYHLNQYTK